ncbi:MAG: DUF2318 domain-containing protein [Spirochaetae bacterium HGW-Spirochaetae-5]|nr:MAG: DUF2318 domain-containing protein [Spirochaetae bacterium HGW-Spirochaetae-5]
MKLYINIGKKITVSLVVSFIILSIITGCGKEDAISVNKLPEVSDGAITFPAPDFDDGAAKFYNYEDNGIKIRFFILKSSDGEIRAAFDSCDVCWRADKGYEQRGDSMICRNCGQSFRSDKINTVKGGCNPSPLERSSADGKIIIKVDDILKGREYFDFKKRS